MDEPPRDLLYERYVIQRQTIREIASELALSVRRVRTLLRAHDIPLRSSGPRRDIPKTAVGSPLRAELRQHTSVLGAAAAARHHGISREVLEAFIDARALPRGQRPRADDAVIRQEYRARRDLGEPAMRIVAELATRFACSTATIHRSLRRTCVVDTSYETKEE